jgi:hypothetical protein
MTATITILGDTATIDSYRWSCPANPLTEAMLNARLDPDGPAGSDPNPDLNAARAAAEAFGGQVISYQETAFDPEAIY